MKIQKKLPALVILITVVPLLLLSAFLQYFLSGSLLAKNEALLTDKASGITELMTSFYEDQARSLGEVSGADIYTKALRQPDDATALADASAFAELSVQSNSNLNESTIINVQGRIIAASDASLIAADVRGTDYFAALSAREEKFFEQFVWSEKRQSWELSLATRITDSNGVLLGFQQRSLNLAYIGEFVKAQKVGNSDESFVITTTGQGRQGNLKPQLIAGDIDLDNLLENPELQSLVTDVAYGRHGETEGFVTYDYHGVPCIAAYSVLPQPDCIVISQMNKDEVFEDANYLQSIILVATITIAAVALILGNQLAAMFTKPLKYLTGKITALANEDFSVRANIKGGDEFAELAASLNKMAERLESRRHELVKTNESLQKTAYLDALTGIANRKSIYQTIDDLFRVHPNQAFILLDLNSFKVINDTFGKQIGDSVLLAVGSALKPFATETIHISRLGGDEYLIFISNYENPQDVVHLTERIIAAIAAIRTVQSVPVDLKPSAGISYLLDKTDNRNVWLTQADDALRIAKREGENNYHIFESEYEIFGEE